MASRLPPYTLPPSLDDLETLAINALETIPAPLRARLGAIVLRVDEFPDDETEEEMGLESGFDLLGLYQGHPLTQRSLSDTGILPDIIFLYRRPILDYWCETGEDLAGIVRHVLIHEIGHHFGFSDDDMERLEEEAG